MKLKRLPTISLLLCLVNFLLAEVNAAPLFSSATENEDPQLLFTQAMQLRKEGKLSVAVEIFQVILSKHPQLQRARLELAVAYYQQLNYQRAKELAMIVLNDPKTPNSVITKIKRFVSQITAAAPKHLFSPSLSLGVMSDSNVTAGPDSSVLDGFPTLIVTAKQSDQASLSQFGFSYRYVPGKARRSRKNASSFLWLSKVNYFSADYQKNNNQDLGILSFRTGPAFLKLRRWRSGVNLQLDKINLAGKSYAEYAALNTSFIKIYSKQKVEVGIDFFMQRRNYKKESDAGRKGDYYALGVNYGKLTKNEKLSFQIGVRPFTENLDAARFSNRGIEWFAGVGYKLSKQNTMILRLSRKTIKYDGLIAGMDARRDEILDRIVLGIEHKVNVGVLKGWTVKIYSTYTKNESNLDLFDYDRVQTAFTLNKKF